MMSDTGETMTDDEVRMLIECTKAHRAALLMLRPAGLSYLLVMLGQAAGFAAVAALMTAFGIFTTNDINRAIQAFGAAVYLTLSYGAAKRGLVSWGLYLGKLRGVEQRLETLRVAARQRGFE